MPITRLNINLLILPLLIISFTAGAQVLPKPGSTLNYTQVMLDYPPIEGATEYLIQVSEDSAGKNFTHPIIQQRDSSTATLIGGLKFGHSYSWRYASSSKPKGSWQGPFLFKICADSITQTDKYNINILSNTYPDKGLIISDCPHVVFDRQGAIVWAMPQTEFLGPKLGVREMRLTPAGTITFITDQGANCDAVEIDLQGNLLFKAPDDGKVSGDSTEYYHHDFKRLVNGNYMVLSKTFKWLAVPEAYKAKYENNKADTKLMNDTLFARIEFGTIIEYTPAGKVAWQWNSSSYLSGADIFAVPNQTEARTPEKRLPGDTLPPKTNSDAHINAFSADDAGEYVYAGFRNISRVIKIEKKTGRVVYSWGAKTTEAEAMDGNNFFCTQHDAQILPNGNVAVFNNNNYAAGATPHAVVFTQPTATSKSKIDFSFTCDFDTTTPNKSIRGGNVDQLPNQHYFICMGNANKMVEVSPEKKIIWSAAVERKSRVKGERLQAPLYRAHFVPSLYPCYFTIQLTGNKTNEPVLKIVNEGTETDSYIIKTGSGLKNEIRTAKVAPGQSVTVKLAVGVIKPIVTSVTNPAFSRTIKR